MNILTCADLILMGRDIPTPFYLSINKDHDQEVIRIEKILRVVPGKRIVALTNWKNSSAVMKLFLHGGNIKRNVLRDLRGINLLRQGDIATPSVLYQTTTADERGSVLLIEYLQEGASLGSLFEAAADTEEQDRLISLAVEVVAKCHQAGLLQRDIHLDNFMLSRNRVFLLDGGDVVPARGGLNVAAAAENLALFFAQFPVTMDSKIKELLHHYSECSSQISIGDSESFLARVHAARVNRLRHFEKKLFRSTTANRCIQNSGTFIIYDRNLHSDELEKFIDQPDSYIEAGEIIKLGNSSTVARVRIGEKGFVLKRYNIKSFWHGLKRLFQPSRAHNSWLNAHVLGMLGVATARPYLMMEERVLWILRRRAYFLAEDLDAEDLATQLHSGALEDEANLAQEFAQLFRTLRDYKISHGDMKATNFLFKNDKIHVLDLDAMQRNSSSGKFESLHKKDKARFQRNWLGTRWENMFGELAKSS